MTVAVGVKSLSENMTSLCTVARHGTVADPFLSLVNDEVLLSPAVRLHLRRPRPGAPVRRHNR